MEIISRKKNAILLIIGVFIIPLNAQKIVRYYYFADSSLVYRWERDSIVNHSGYLFSYNNIIIQEHSFKKEDTTDLCFGCPYLFTDSVCQKYEVISIRKKPFKKYDRKCRHYNPAYSKLRGKSYRKWHRERQGYNCYMIDIADTLHKNYFTIVSLKNSKCKKRVVEKIQIGKIYDMVLYDVNYPPNVTGFYYWGCAPFLGLSFDRHIIHAYRLMISPNINGLFYMQPDSLHSPIIMSRKYGQNISKNR